MRLSWSRTPPGPRPYFGARYYGASIARFTTVDPVYSWKENRADPQRWNRYAYGRNNPFRYVDPDGEDVVLVVRNNAGGGMTNFGHTALRVFGQGYDVTYDFGRYAGGRGFMLAKGPGILRVWSDHGAFLKGQAPEGDLRTLTYKTSHNVDEAIMADFSTKIAKGKERPGRAGFKEYQLAEDYDLTKNNCTTICIGAIGGAQGSTGFKFPGYEGLQDEYDPGNLYKDVSGVNGLNHEATADSGGHAGARLCGGMAPVPGAFPPLVPKLQGDRAGRHRGGQAAHRRQDPERDSRRSDDQLARLHLEPHAFHGDWNYTLWPTARQQ